jgi:GNAT superfamily N-acetyltransferase
MNMDPPEAIQPAGEPDGDVLAEVIRRAYTDVAVRFGLTPGNCPRHPSNCTAAWIREDCARGVRYFLLAGPGGALGCVALEQADEETWYLERLAVLPHARRRGRGRRLVDHALERARIGGARVVSIGLIAEQADLKAWYQRQGFSETGNKVFAHLPFAVTFMAYPLPRHG